MRSFLTFIEASEFSFLGEEYKSLVEKRETARLDYEKKFTETTTVGLTCIIATLLHLDQFGVWYYYGFHKNLLPSTMFDHGFMILYVCNDC